jgi:hypothetical protein
VLVRILMVASLAGMVPIIGCRGSGRSGATLSPGIDAPTDTSAIVDVRGETGPLDKPTDGAGADLLVDGPADGDTPDSGNDFSPISDGSPGSDTAAVPCGRAGATCSDDSDCCGRACLAGKCCETVPGQSCSGEGDCCGRTCLRGGFGTACCGSRGASCSFGVDCCSGVCQRVSGVSLLCGCIQPGAPCKTSTDCCQGSCRAGLCTCTARREPCHFNVECCSNVCRDGSCL